MRHARGTRDHRLPNRRCGSRPADATMRRKWARGGAPSERFSAATPVAYRPETSVESDGAGRRPLIVRRRRRVRRCSAASVLRAPGAAETRAVGGRVVGARLAGCVSGRRARRGCERWAHGKQRPSGASRRRRCGEALPVLPIRRGPTNFEPVTSQERRWRGAEH